MNIYRHISYYTYYYMKNFSGIKYLFESMSGYISICDHISIYNFASNTDGTIKWIWYDHGGELAHVAIDHSHSQQPMPRGFSLFKRCEWLVDNRNVGKRASLSQRST